MAEIPSTATPSTTLVWAPQPGPQQALVDCTLPEIFLGGARGGGKTDGVLGKWVLKERRYGKTFNAIALRRTTVSFEDAIERSREIYGPLGGRFNATRLTWRMPHGGRVSFGYLENIHDAAEYQGRNISDCWIEEAGQYPTPDAIDRMFGVLRSAHGVPTQLILTANPGGAGQHWLRSRYGLVPFPRYPKVLLRKLPNGKQHQVAVIPARIGDNAILMRHDPHYIDRLQLVGSPALVRAWIDGDWSSVEGAFFEVWSEMKHVLRPTKLPEDWLRYRAADWGSASPFAIGWLAVVQDDWTHPDGATLPRGALVMYRELYGTKDPSAGGLSGLKMTAEEVADAIIRRERDDPKLAQAVLDPSAFAEAGGPSIAERINTKLIKAGMAAFREADNKRVTAVLGGGKRGPMGGWDMLRARLVGQNGRPTLYVFNTCTATCRTMPVLQHDPLRPEDLDTNSEDHCADMIRYACMARPWLAPPKPQVEHPEPRYVPYSSEDFPFDFAGYSIKTL
jgi:terminase large subunit-like protein